MAIAAYKSEHRAYLLTAHTVAIVTTCQGQPTSAVSIQSCIMAVLQCDQQQLRMLHGKQAATLIESRMSDESVRVAYLTSVCSSMSCATGTRAVPTSTLLTSERS